jgi:hypothetical protein
MGISAKVMALLAISGGLMLAGCGPTATSSGAEHWNAVSAMVNTSPQLAERKGELNGRCGGAGGTRDFSNASVEQDRTVYRIERGDKLHLSFYRNSEFDRYAVECGLTVGSPSTPMAT